LAVYYPVVLRLGLGDGLIQKKSLYMNTIPKLILLRNIVVINMANALRNYSAILLILSILIDPMQKSIVNEDFLGDQFMNM